VTAYRPKARRPSTDIDDSLQLRNTGNDKNPMCGASVVLARITQ
jgi:hypothetical protein